MTSSFISATLTEQDWRDATRIAHRWYHWPLRIIQDSHAYAFVYVAVAAGGAAMLYPKYRTREVLLGALGSLALSAFLFLLTNLIRVRALKRKLAKHNAEIGTWAFSDRGLFHKINGSLRLERWTAFREATLTPEILVLRSAGQRSVRRLSIEGFSSSEREELRAILKQNLGPGKTKEASIRRSRLRPNVIRNP